MWALRYFVYFSAAFIISQLFFLYAWHTQMTSAFLTKTITKIGLSEEEPRKLVLFALTYVGYKTPNSYKSGHIVQMAARELYGDQRNISFFMEPNFSYHRSFGESFIHLDEEPREILRQKEGLQKLVEFFREIRGTGKKLLLFNSDLKHVDRKLKEFFGDADVLSDLIENVYAAGEWYYLVYRSYYEKYPEDAEKRFHSEVTKPLVEKSEKNRENGDTFLEHALAVQVPFLTSYKLGEANFDHRDLRILSDRKQDNVSNFDVTTQAEEEIRLENIER